MKKHILGIALILMVANIAAASSGFEINDQFRLPTSQLCKVIGKNAAGDLMASTATPGREYEGFGRPFIVVKCNDIPGLFKISLKEDGSLSQMQKAEAKDINAETLQKLINEG